MKKGLVSITPFLALLFFAWFFRWLFPTYFQSISLFLAGILCFLIPLDSQTDFFPTLKTNFRSILPAMEILALVGILIRVWGEIGTIQLIMDLGIHYLSPAFFLNSCVFATSLFALVSGSSWTTAGTLGLALIGVGDEFQIPKGLVAGAVVSGCYFGDKMSPLSDTTNLAASITKTDLKTHIIHMSKTTIPSYMIANFFFYIASPKLSQLSVKPYSEQDLVLLLPVILVFFSSFFKIKPRASLIIGIVSAFLLVSLFPHFPLQRIGQIAKLAIFDSSELGAGGLESVFPTELLICSAIWFGTSLEANGFLKIILESVLFSLQSTRSILISCMCSSIVLNLTTADQYLSLVIPGKSFSALAEKNNIPSRDISRALEDTGTLSSPLIPWNSCGAFMALSLGVPVGAYFFYAWFQWIHILSSFLWVILKKKS